MRSLLYLRLAAPGSMALILDSARRKGRYRLYPGTIPAGYPRPSPEIRELAWRDASAGWALLVPEEPDRTFFWAKALSEAAEQTPVCGVHIGATGRWCAKLYAAGHPVAKVGEDPDRELFYPVPEATATQMADAERLLQLTAAQLAVFRSWSQARHQTPRPSAESFAMALALPWFDSTWRAAEPEQWNIECWVRMSSPLWDRS